MTERLFEAGKRILEHNRRLTLLPQQPGLPLAYAMLLLDPADLLADAWATLFSAPDSEVAAGARLAVERHSALFPPNPYSTRAASAAMPSVVRHAEHGLAQHSPLDIDNNTFASRMFDSPAARAPSERDAARLQSTPASSVTARPEWSPKTNWPLTPKTHWPLSLVKLTSKHFASGAQQRDASGEKAASASSPSMTATSVSWPSTRPYRRPPALPDQRPAIPFEESRHSEFAHSDSAAQTEASLTTRAISVAPSDSLTPTPASLPHAESAEAFLPPVALRPAPAPRASNAQTRAATTRAKLFGDREAIPTPPASTIRAAATRQSEEAHLSSVNFTSSPSRLADVLNANVNADASSDARVSDLEATGAMQRVDVQPDSLSRSESLQAREVNPFDARHENSSHSVDARERGGWDKPPESNGQARGADAPLVEAVLEELYERLRLEFLRTYGTSGE